MNKVIVAALVSAAALLSAGTAHADDDGYISMLKMYGLNVGSPELQQVALKLGRAICGDMRAGSTSASSWGLDQGSTRPASHRPARRGIAASPQRQPPC
jgi:hypothetical protein